MRNKWLQGAAVFSAGVLSIQALVPLGFRNYLNGLELAFIAQTNVEDLRNWAVRTAADHSQGSVDIDHWDEVPWGAREGRLLPDELPNQLRRGIFRRQPHGPFVGVYGEKQGYVAVSWYYYGFLIGDRSFDPAEMSHWRPQYQTQVRAGIYLYAFSK